MPRICDYEGSRYRTDFWEGQNREYEDRVERVAMQKLLPPRGERLLEIGAGFGRPPAGEQAKDGSHQQGRAAPRGRDGAGAVGSDGGVDPPAAPNA